MLRTVWVVPVSVAVIVPTSFVLTYILAVWQGHVQAFMPYISDTGSYPPESCIFAQMINLAAVIIGVVMYFRHRQIAEFYRHSQESRRKLLDASTLFLWIGYSSAFGFSMVGNFQQTYWMSAHMCGAGMAFGLGLVYCWGQTVFTYKMHPVIHGRWVAHVRLCLALFATICFLLMATMGFNPFYDITPGRKNYTVYLCMPGVWQLVEVLPDEPGYPYHITTTISEWLTSFAFMSYFMTYAVELRHAVLFPPKLVLTVGECQIMPHLKNVESGEVEKGGKKEPVKVVLLSMKETKKTGESLKLKSSAPKSK